jgi:hypothetical protein
MDNTGTEGLVASLTYNGHPVANTEYENMIQLFHWGTYF